MAKEQVDEGIAPIADQLSGRCAKLWRACRLAPPLHGSLPEMPQVFSWPPIGVNSVVVRLPRDSLARAALRAAWPW